MPLLVTTCGFEMLIARGNPGRSGMFMCTMYSYAKRWFSWITRWCRSARKFVTEGPTVPVPTVP